MKSLLFLVPILFLSACNQQTAPPSIDLNQALGGSPAEGFQRAEHPRAFHFPEDHAAHPQFRNEWWYITGNLRDTTGRHYGYQVTFFRIALIPQAPSGTSPWATNQVWMAHVALSDIQANRHWHDERLSRGAAGLAGQSHAPFKIWLEDWQIIGSEQGDFPWTIDLSTESFALNLQLSPKKPIVLQGEEGLSRKSAEPGNASYYYSMTRLETQGSLLIKGASKSVQGWSWLDREWSTSALASDQAGWDWFSLQFQEGEDLMFYRLRKKDGSTDTQSAGKWIPKDDDPLQLSKDDVVLRPLRYWSSPTGSVYPVVWEMHIARLDKRFRVEALIDDQEMVTGIVYWEGAVKILDASTRQPLGYGYLEMTGY
jgi:predicted secreted hydrolase